MYLVAALKGTEKGRKETAQKLVGLNAHKHCPHTLTADSTQTPGEHIVNAFQDLTS